MSSTPSAAPPGPSSVARERRLVLVVGTGRSGTSTMAGVLRRLGLHVPQPEVAADATNPKGFSEPRWVVDFHDELLRAGQVQVSDARPSAWQRAGASTHDPRTTDRLAAWLGSQFEQGDQLLVKDPRILWFLPLWVAAARRHGVTPACLTMLRPPPEVVGSKRASYNRGLDDTHGLAAWLNLMLGTEHATRGAPRAFVDYHALLADWQPMTTRIGAQLDLALADPTGPETRARITDFVDPGLRRVRLQWDDLRVPPRLRDLALETWVSLERLTDPRTATPDVLERLDAVRAAYAAYYEESEAVARSSVIAARDDRRTRPPTARRPRSGRLLVRAVRRIPVRVRRSVPARWRVRAHAWLMRSSHR